MNLCYIRKELKSELPVEIWHLGKKECNFKMFSAIKDLGSVRFFDVYEHQKTYPMKPNNLEPITKGLAPASTEGWRSKAYVLLHSNFKELIFLDSDCFLFKKPEYLFDHFPEYISNRAVFSADIDTNPETTRKVDPKTFLLPRVGTFSNKEWDYSKSNPMWFILGIQEDDLPEFDSGFMMIDKGSNVESVFMSFFLNENSDFVYRYLYGDKDTFHMAWRFCNSPCHVIKDVSRNHENIVAKIDGSILFEHRVFIYKFDVEKNWGDFPNNNKFHMREKFKFYFEEAKKYSSIKIF
jgi:hypothetical protein